MKKQNVDEVLKHTIRDDDTLPYELKTEMWSNIEREVVTTRMSRRNRLPHRSSGVLAGVGTVAVLACVVFGGKYFFTHRSLRTTTATHPPGTVTTTNHTNNSSTGNTSRNNSAVPSTSSIPNTSQNATSSTPSKQNGTSTTTSSGVTVHSYASVVQATNAIDAIQQGGGQFYPSGPNLNLGNGISAEQEGSLGSLHLKWTEGRWTILTNLASSNAMPQAKQMVSYLHTHMLPIPQSKGVITVTQSYNSSSPTIYTKTTIAWQVGTKVYEIQKTGDPVSALKTAVGETNQNSTEAPAKVEITATPNPIIVGQDVTIHVRLLTANGVGAGNQKFTLNVPNNLNNVTVYTDANGNYTTHATWSKAGTYIVTAGNGKIGWQTSITVK